jgi:4-amino-4-deoxy-L-arabinose transferase-like glycosyltransferase
MGNPVQPESGLRRRFGDERVTAWQDRAPRILVGVAGACLVAGVIAALMGAAHASAALIVLGTGHALVWAGLIALLNRRRRRTAT